MRTLREWATPLTIGAFFISAITGIAMFFHLDRGQSKAAHEYLGWLLVAGVALHVAVNFASFRRHLTQGRGRWLVLLLVLFTAGTFVELSSGPPPVDPRWAVTDAVLDAPISQVAALAHKDTETLLAELRTAGFTVRDGDQSLAEIAGDDRGSRFHALATAFEP